MATSNCRKNKEENLDVCPISKGNGIINIQAIFTKFCSSVYSSFSNKNTYSTHFYSIVTLKIGFCLTHTCPVFPHKVQSFPSVLYVIHILHCSKTRVFKIWPMVQLPILLKYCFIETEPFSFIYMLTMTNSLQQWQILAGLSNFDIV